MEEKPLTITAGSYSVVIWTTKIDDNLDKLLTEIPIPNQKDAQDSETEPDSWIVDLGRIKQAISIQGFLRDETTESAFTKKKNLFKIVKFKREVILQWGSGNKQQTAKGNINKCQVTETAGIIGEQQSGYYNDKNFAVQFSFIVGTSVTDQ